MEWVNINERLPEGNGAVLVWQSPNRNVAVAYFYSGKFYETLRGGFTDTTIQGVTCWLPIPEPPKEQP